MAKNVSNATVLRAALKSKIGGVIVVGWDSRKKQYVAASGTVEASGDLDAKIHQLREAVKFLQKIRAKALRREKRAK